MLFGDDLAVELVLLFLFFREQHIAPFLEMGKAALDAPRAAAVEPDGGAGQVGEEAAVMADDHQRGAARVEIALQPLDGGEIEMVGRLIEQQNVGRRRQHISQRHAPRLATGQMRRVFVALEAKLLDQMTGDVGIVGRL